MTGTTLGRLLRTALRVVGTAVRADRATPRTPGRPPARTGGSTTGSAAGGSTTAEPATDPYPGDFTGRVAPRYAPDPDGDPDPGEIVWTWVPFEEDHSRGKDRPVLLVGRDGRWLLGLMLSSRDHDSRPAPSDERWLELGTGDWDARRRPSEVRLDRVVRVDPSTVRREGAVLDRHRFDQVVGSLPGAAG